MGGTDERLFNGPIRLSVIGCNSTVSCLSTEIVETKMLSKEYLDTARTILRAAREMTDQHAVDRLKALAENYERRAEKAVRTDPARASARPAARDCEALS